MGAVLSSRRSRAAGGMMLLVLLVGGAWAGLAQAETALPGPLLDEPPFVPPGPRVHDEGTYKVRLADAPEPYDVRFRWLPDDAIHGAFQGHHRTNELAVVWPEAYLWERRGELHSGPYVHDPVYSLDQTTRDTVAVRNALNHTYVRNELVLQRSHAFSYEDIHLQDQDPAPQVPCMFVARVEEAGGSVDTRPCGLLDYRQDKDLTLHLTQTMRAAGLVYSHYAAETDHLRIEQLLRADLPYPVRTAVSLHDGQVLEEWTLVNLTRGTVPLGQQKSPESPLPDVDWRPWGRDGPDVSGIPLVLPLIDAVNVAKEEDARLQSFLQEHPDAFLHYGEYQTYADEHEAVYLWALVYGSGFDQHGVCIEDRRPVRPPADLSTALRQRGTTKCDQTVIGPSGIAPDAPPKLAPTVASVQSWYDTYRLTIPELEPANAVTFHAKCLDKDCVARRTAIAVGHRFQSDTPEGPAGLPTFGGDWSETYYASALVVDGTGAPERLTYRMGESRDVTGAPAEDPDGRVAEPPRTLTAVEAAPVVVDAPIFTPTETATVGLVAVLLGLLTWSLPTLKNLILGPLFTRIQRPKILDHEMRARIRAIVDAEPGIHGRALARRLGLARGSLMHHVRMMEQAQALRVVRTRGYAAYFPPSDDAPDTPEGLAHVRSDTARTILHHIGTTPGASASEIARLLGLSPQGVLHHVARLVDGGLVDRDEARRPAPLRLTSAGRMVLDRLRPRRDGTSRPDPS